MGKFGDRLEAIDNYFRGDDEQSRFSINSILLLGCAAAGLVAGIIDVSEWPDLRGVPRIEIPGKGLGGVDLTDDYISENFGG